MAIPAAVQLAISLPGEKGMDVCVIDLDGGDIRRLTEGGGWDRFPAWSPDGTQIAFTSSPPTGDGPRSERVWVMDAEGSEPVPIAKGMGAKWSPDGSQLAF